MKTESADIRNIYISRERRKKLILLAGIAVMIMAGFYFVTVGYADTDIKQAFGAVSAWLNGSLGTGDRKENSIYKIILFMRMPRIIMAVIAGTGLSVSGSAMQAVTRNPLVSPFTVGISSAAAFGASMFIVFGTGSEGGTIFWAFVSSMVCVLFMYAVSMRNAMKAETIVLTGIALNYFFSALSSSVEFFADEYKLSSIVQWSFGTFNGSGWSDTVLSGAITLAGTIIIASQSRKMDIMSYGDDEFSVGLGINPAVTRVLICVVSVMMTAAVISFTGVIGFVGLAAPHISRMIIGNGHKYLIPFSAIMGSTLLMAADAIGRTMLSPVSIPVGIVVSFLGVPILINLILKERRNEP